VSDSKKFDPRYEVMVAKILIENAAKIISDQVNLMQNIVARLQLVVDRQEELADDTDTISDKEAGE